MSAPPRTPLLRHGDFLRLWAAQTVSSLGARITREGLPLTAVIVLHAQPAAIGILAAARGAPALLVGLGAGGVVDRSRKKRLLIGADIARALLLLIVPIAALTHRLTFAEVVIVAAAVAGLSVLFDMADHAFLPVIVERADLIEANTKLSVTESIAEIGGPALAGVLVSAITAPIAIAINAGTYGLSALLLAGMRVKERALAHGAAARTSWLTDARRGFAIAMGEPRVRPMFLATLIGGVAGGFFSALYIVFAIDILKLTPALLGLTIAVGGVGSLIGAAVTQPIVRRLGVGPALIAAYAANAFFTLFVPLAGGGVVQAMLFLMTAQLCGDSAGTAWEILSRSLRQSLVPTETLGRVGGVFAAAAGLAAIIGALVGGEAGQHLGIRTALFIASAGFAVAVAVCALSPLRSLREPPAAPDPDFAA